MVKRLALLLAAAGLTTWFSATISGAGHSQAAAGTTKTVVSLAPSNTELLYAIGAERNLIAVSTNCNYPPEAKQKPKAGNFISANLEKLSRLAPDAVVLVSGQEQLAGLLTRKKFAVSLLPNHTLSQIPENVRKLGTLTGREDKAAQLSRDFNCKIDQMKATTARTSFKPKVFLCVWSQPLLTVGAGSYLNEVVTVCGGKNIAADMKPAYPQFSLERLLASQPDVIIMPTAAEKQTFWKQGAWSSLKAVKSKKIFFIPKAYEDALFRPTLRLVDGMAWLSTKLQPPGQALVGSRNSAPQTDANMKKNSLSQAKK
jgi:iron complex transport system substrate-binding protein